MACRCENQVLCFPTWRPANGDQALSLQGSQTTADIALVAGQGAHQFLVTA